MTQQPDGPREDQRGDEPRIDLNKPRPGAAQPPPAYPPPPGSTSGPASGPPSYGGYQQPAPGGWQQPGSYPPPQQWQGQAGPMSQPGSRLTPAEERTWAGAAHWSALIAMVFAMAFLGPLIVLLVKGNDSGFVRRQAVESLNFQLTILIAGIVSFALVFVLIGFLLLPLVGLAWLVFTVIGAVKSSSGDDYRYPFAIRMVH